MLDDLKVGDELYSATIEVNEVKYRVDSIWFISDDSIGLQGMFNGRAGNGCAVPKKDIFKYASPTKELAKERLLNNLLYELTTGLDKELEEKKKEIDDRKSFIKEFLTKEGVSSAR